MMLKPYMSELLKKVKNRYLLVNVTARRARDIATESEEAGIDLTKKPVTIALEEIYDGTVVPAAGEGKYDEENVNTDENQD